MPHLHVAFCRLYYLNLFILNYDYYIMFIFLSCVGRSLRKEVNIIHFSLFWYSAKGHWLLYEVQI